jgi:hypothetical protein
MTEAEAKTTRLVPTLDNDMTAFSITAAFSVEATMKAGVMMTLDDNGFSICRSSHRHAEG